MNALNESLVIDAGNTRIKVAYFRENVLEEVQAFNNTQLSELKKHLQGKQGVPTIISSVKSAKDTRWIHQFLPHAVLFSSQLKLPIGMGYETPETLGADRLCNAIAGYHQSKTTCLSIDLGTCIKYDFVSAEGTYLGGSISPGVAMRFRAMHEFTDKLPLIKEFETVPNLLGKNTISAMQSGVMQGIKLEISGVIATYKQQFPELTIFLTGGDAVYFDLGAKNGIFADENLTLKGLQITLAQL